VKLDSRLQRYFVTVVSGGVGLSAAKHLWARSEAASFGRDSSPSPRSGSRHIREAAAGWVE